MESAEGFPFFRKKPGDILFAVSKIFRNKQIGIILLAVKIEVRY